jgi:hypothetical protein
MKICAMKAVLYIRLYPKLCSCFLRVLPDLDKLSTGDVHKTVLSDCELYENWHNENHALLWGINEFLSVLSTFLNLF